jgi:hypothetical protein
MEIVKMLSKLAEIFEKEKGYSITGHEEEFRKWIMSSLNLN